jgi:hypothetical protein
MLSEKEFMFYGYSEEAQSYLNMIDSVKSPGLITNCFEWIAEGWGLEAIPSLEQIAASLFMEANTQDKCVMVGDSIASYPNDLRTFAYEILKLAGHDKPDIIAK